MLFNINKGFTLIELVVVIVILGILSVTALPKFINLNQEAERAVFEGYYGALKSAVKIYSLSWQAKGQPSGSFNDFSSVPSITGYPAGGSNLTAVFESDCITIWNDLIQGSAPTLGFITANNGWSGSISKEDWVSNASQITVLGESEDLYCHFVYIAAYNNGSLSGQAGERILAIQYNIKTGNLAKVEWPFNP